ncbi:MAG: hypothetical protein EOL88_01580 [Bacteroidia bacterium]|nr:hypothetical protein [Bacteroidia bacterium]
MNSKDKICLANTLAVITGIAVLFIGLLLLLNYFQLQAHDPLDSEILTLLVERLRNEPDNESLKEEIRVLDLMARKAFFTAQWQIRTGSYLLVILSVVCIAALRYRRTALHRIPFPVGEAADLIVKKKSAFWYSFVLLIVFFAFALWAAIVSIRNYVDYAVLDSVVVKQSEEDDIEIIALFDNEISNPAIPSENIDTDSILSRKEKKIAPEQNERTLPVKADSVMEETVKIVYPSASAYRTQHASFRGPYGQGVIYHEDVPSFWDGASGEGIVWKTALKTPGFSSPVVWEDHVYITSGDEHARTVSCYHATDGRLLWEHTADQIPGSPVKIPKTTDDTGLAAPTPATNGHQVFAIFGTGDMVALDRKGERIWAKNLGVPDNHYGYSSSLMCLNRHVFVQYDDNKGARLLALDAESGAIIWETKRKSKISWSSPVLAEIDGKYQLILTFNPGVAGYDTENGKELWRVDCLTGEVGPSAGFWENKIIVANEYANLVVIDALNSYSVIWESMEYLPEVSSPVAYADLVFVATSYGILAAFDIQGGELVWEQDYGDGFYSSPVIVGNKLYLFELSGKAYIVEAAAEYNEIAAPELGERVFTTPAFKDGFLFVRGEKHLFCIGKK